MPSVHVEKQLPTVDKEKGDMVVLVKYETAPLRFLEVVGAVLLFGNKVHVAHNNGVDSASDQHCTTTDGFVCEKVYHLDKNQ